MQQRPDNTTFSKRRARLGLSVKAAAAWLKEPYPTVKGWNQGRFRAPRCALRLLAVYRLRNWGKY